MKQIDKDRNTLKRLVESYGKKDVLNFINHLNESYESYPNVKELPYFTEEDKKQYSKFINNYLRAPKRFINDFYIDRFGWEQSVRDVCFGLAKEEFGFDAEALYSVEDTDEDFEYEKLIDDTIDFISSEADRMTEQLSKYFN